MKSVWNLTLKDGATKMVTAEVCHLTPTGDLLFGSMKGGNPDFTHMVANHHWAECRKSDLVQ